MVLALGGVAVSAVVVRLLVPEHAQVLHLIFTPLGLGFLMAVLEFPKPGPIGHPKGNRRRNLVFTAATLYLAGTACSASSPSTLLTTLQVAAVCCVAYLPFSARSIENTRIGVFMLDTIVVPALKKGTVRVAAAIYDPATDKVELADLMTVKDIVSWGLKNQKKYTIAETEVGKQTVRAFFTGYTMSYSETDETWGGWMVLVAPRTELSRQCDTREECLKAFNEVVSELRAEKS
jgi:hypothetical protein